MITFEQVSFAYTSGTRTQQVLHNIDLCIKKHEYVAFIGPNGSGKSTLLKHMNGLLIPSQGTVTVDGRSTSDEANLPLIRQKVGIVFQNPENQMVATTVYDDVAFGLENIGFPSEQMPDRIEQALQKVGMWEQRESEPHQLSGGQMQRVAIAGILAVKPDIILFDEATSMLDPHGRAQMRQILRELHQEGLTIVTVTHDMDEASDATRLIVVHQGQIMLDDHPSVIFEKEEWLKGHQLSVPFAIEARNRLREQGLHIPQDIKTTHELVKHLWTLS